MQKNANSARKNKNTLAVALVCLCFLLLLSSFLAACLLAKQDAINAQGGDTPDPDPTDATENQTGEPEPPQTLQSGETTYVSLPSVGIEPTLLADGLYRFTCDGDTAVFVSTEVSDCILDGRLCLSPAPALLHEEALYLPSAFLEHFFDTETTQGGTSLTVSAAHTSSPALPAGLDAAAYFDGVTKAPEFVSDLSAYEEDMNPKAYNDYMVLANAENSLGADYAPDDLERIETEFARYPNGSYHAMLRRSAARALNAFLTEAYAVGYSDVEVTSGYRSYSDQKYRFETKVNSLLGAYATREEAEAAAATVIQWPGKSEHQTGLACDMHNLPAADTSFGETRAAEWLADNAHQFGFILRYPEDKVHITGISYEPWHFRFVGRYHATRMHLLGLTMEEYAQFLSASEALI